MAGVLAVVGMIIGGYLLGWLYTQFAEGPGAKQVKLASYTLDNTWLEFLGETFYFSTIFSVPFSGNVPLSGIILAMFLYALFGSFGKGPSETGTPEDAVASKWHNLFP